MPGSGGVVRGVAQFLHYAMFFDPRGPKNAADVPFFTLYHVIRKTGTRPFVGIMPIDGGACSSLSMAVKGKEGQCFFGISPLKVFRWR